MGSDKNRVDWLEPLFHFFVFYIHFFFFFFFSSKQIPELAMAVAPVIIESSKRFLLNSIKPSFIAIGLQWIQLLVEYSPHIPMQWEFKSQENVILEVKKPSTILFC